MVRDAAGRLAQVERTYRDSQLPAALDEEHHGRDYKGRPADRPGSLGPGRARPPGCPWWRAANYLSVGQIYLLDNPLLREPLRLEHVKPRLLGHWGTTPGLNFVYVHLNRVIVREDLDVIYVTGPGHGGPGLVANVYLEGTYSEVYPHIGED